MQKIIVGLLGTTLLLTACSTKDNHHESNKEHKTNTTQQETKRDDHATHKLPLHQLLSGHNAKLVITLKKGVTASEVSNTDLIKNSKESLKKYEISNIGYIKNGKGYNYNDKMNNKVTFDQLIETPVPDVDRKLTKLTEHEMNSGINDSQNKVDINYQPSPIKTILYTKDHAQMKEEVQLADFQREMDMSGDIGEEETNWRSNHNKINDDDLANNFPKVKSFDIEPFEYKGKTFAGFATPEGDAQSSDNNVEDQNILELTLFEVPKDTKIIKDKNNDADHIIDYQNSDDDKQEKDQKDHSFDNL